MPGEQGPLAPHPHSQHARGVSRRARARGRRAERERRARQNFVGGVEHAAGPQGVADRAPRVRGVEALQVRPAERYLGATVRRVRRALYPQRPGVARRGRGRGSRRPLHDGHHE